MRARGFTLIELTVVITMIGLMAAIVIPRVLGLREAGTSRETSSKLLAAVETGRELARSRGERIVVGLDGPGGAVTIAGADENVDDRFETSVRIPGAFSVTNVDRTQVGTGSGTTEARATSGETLGVFFEDGTAEPATAEVTVGNLNRTLRVDADGTVTIGSDLEPPVEREKWQAGDLENRA